MKKSELRKIISEVIKEQLGGGNKFPTKGEKLTTGCLDPIAINYCSVCTEACLGGPGDNPASGYIDNMHPESYNGCCLYTAETVHNQQPGTGHIQGVDSFGSTVSIPRDKIKYKPGINEQKRTSDLKSLINQTIKEQVAPMKGDKTIPTGMTLYVIECNQQGRFKPPSGNISNMNSSIYPNALIDNRTPNQSDVGRTIQNEGSDLRSVVLKVEEPFTYNSPNQVNTYLASEQCQQMSPGGSNTATVTPPPIASNIPLSRKNASRRPKEIK